MNRKMNYTSGQRWQKVQTVIKHVVIQLYGRGVIPERQVKALFEKLPGLRDA